MSGSGVDVPVGRTTVMSETGHVTYKTEADLRDALAAFAWMCGWDVQTEAAIEGWGGRVDVLASCGKFQIAFEVKKRLTQVGAIRKGFQQADGYRRALNGDPDMPVQVGNVTHIASSVVTVLTAADVDFDLAKPMNTAYHRVSLRDWWGSRRLLRAHAYTVADRAVVAAHRLDGAMKVVELCKAETGAVETTASDWTETVAVSEIRRFLPAMADDIQRTINAQKRWAA